MGDSFVRASGGFSKKNMDDKYTEGYNEGVADTKVGTAVASEVLAGKTFTRNDAVGVTGTMPNKGKTDITLTSRNGSQQIPMGYHNGTGVVKVAAASQRKTLAGTDVGVVSLGAYNDYKEVDTTAVYNAGAATTKVGNAQVGDVLSGKTFTNSTAVGATGTMPNNGSNNITVAGRGQETGIPAGYYNGSGKVVIANASAKKTISAQEAVGYNNVDMGAQNNYRYVDATEVYNKGVTATKVGTAAAADVLSDKTFTNSSSVGASGSMPNKGSTNISVARTASEVTIPKGYYNGSGKVQVAAATDRKTLAAGDTGIVSLGTYNNYKEVDASVLASARYNAGINYASDNLTAYSNEDSGSGHIAGNDVKTIGVVENNSGHTKIVVITVAMAKKRGNGYAWPDIVYTGTGATYISGAYGFPTYSDDASSVDANLAMHTVAYKIAPGSEITFKAQETENKSGVYTYTITHIVF